MSALVFANGDAPSATFLQQLRQTPAFVVAADGGARHAIAAGFTLDAVVGDLDSFDDALRAHVPEANLHRVARLDTTDLDKAIEFCIERGHTEVDVVCAGGGRADHALANLSVLTRFRGRAHVRVIDDAFTISLVEGSATIDAPPGTVVSLVAIGECRGVTTSGLRWDLDNFTLPFGPRGVHNEVEHAPAAISVVSGDLLLFRGNWVERHR